MTKLACVAHSSVQDGTFVLATFSYVRRCPARADFVELCFATDEGDWTWCFRDPVERSKCVSGAPIALTVGPYGAEARHVHGSALGLALPSSQALAMILSGSRIYLARRLVRRAATAPRAFSPAAPAL
jgi:hypothetical protein